MTNIEKFQVGLAKLATECGLKFENGPDNEAVPAPKPSNAMTQGIAGAVFNFRVGQLVALIVICCMLSTGCAALKTITTGGASSVLVTDLTAFTSAAEAIVADIPKIPSSVQTAVKNVSSNLLAFGTCIANATLSTDTDDASAILACGAQLPALSSIPTPVLPYVQGAIAAGQVILGLFATVSATGLALARTATANATTGPKLVTLPVSSRDKTIVRKSILPRLTAAK